MTTIRPYRPDDLPAALRLSGAVGWPHGAAEWRLVTSLSDGVVAERDGAVIGTAFCTPFGADAAAINMVVVDSAARGAGLGRRLVEAAIGLAGPRRLRLVATEMGLPLYRRLGFETVGHVAKHEGIAAPLTAPHGIETTPPDLDDLVALDRAATGADRGDLLRHLLAVADCATLRDGGRLTGVALSRPFAGGHVIGPVLAPKSPSAWQLIRHHLAMRPGEHVRIDCVATAPFRGELECTGLAHTGGGVEMAKPVPPTPASPATRHALVAQAFG